MSRFLQYFRPRNRTANTAHGMVSRNRGPSKPMYGMSTPPPMSMAGMLIGGAAIPMIAPMAMIAPAFSFGIPIRSRTGATSAPALRTAAVEDPVIMPGNIITSISRISISAGTL